jgi:putative transposase
MSLFVENVPGLANLITVDDGTEIQAMKDGNDLPPENWSTGNGRIRPGKGADSMRKSRFSEPQIVHILRQADVGEKTIGQLCRDHGISVNTFYRWRRRYGGMGIPELRRQRHLEQENARLKRLLAERDLEVDALRELLAKKS